MAHFIPWRKLNALTMVSDLEVQSVPMSKYCNECKKFTKIENRYYNGFMTGYLPEGKDVHEALEDLEWWEQFDIEHRCSLKATEGGLEETAHPWSELRKYFIQGVEMLEEKIQEGKDAEKLLARVLPNVPNLNKMVKQEQETEEAILNRKVN